MTVPEFKAGYYHAFGKKIKSKAQLNDEIRRERDNGRDIVEVGNDSMKSVKKPKSNYEVDTAMIQKIKREYGC